MAYNHKINNDNKHKNNSAIINSFNENFQCSKASLILPLFNKIGNIWQHPLLLNHNYCLICKEKSIRPNAEYLLRSTHLSENPYDFFKMKGIQFTSLPRNNKGVRRRFIKSQDYKHKPTYDSIDIKMYEGKYDECASDTDLLFINEEEDSIVKDNKSNVNNSSKRDSNSDDYGEIAPLVYNHTKPLEYRSKDRKSSYQPELHNKAHTKMLTNYINNNKIPLDDIKEFKRQSMVQKNDITLEPRLFNQAAGSINEKRGITAKKKNTETHVSILKYFQSMMSLDSNNPNGNINKRNKQDILKGNCKDNDTVNKNIKEESLDNSRKITASDMPHNHYQSKIDNQNISCEVCLQDIKEKFILNCGDFFCKECLRQIILVSLKDISQYHKILCPKEICKEPLNEQVIENLLTPTEFTEYQRIKTRVKGLEDKSLIPCPYPDCDSFGKESSIKRNMLLCNLNHLFCTKCLQIISTSSHTHNNQPGTPSNTSTSMMTEKEHKCDIKKDDNHKYFTSHQFVKKCPNCHSWTFREPGGCNNMTCQNPWCNYEFCWICNHSYDNTHYKNPFSVCFGLGESDHKSKFSQYKSIRVLKCIIIFLLLIFIILPIVMMLFSFIVVGFYVVTFVLDGSAMKNTKLKNKHWNGLFNFFVYVFYIAISIASIPLGYITIGGLVFALPVLCCVNRYKRTKIEEEYES